MFGSAVKKAFFDLWDHLFFALAINVAFTLATLGVSSLGSLVRDTGTAGLFLWLPVPFLFASVLGGIITFWARDIVVDGGARFGDVWSHLASSWKVSVVFSLAWLVLAAGFFFGIPFYTNAINQVVGFIFGMVMAWMVFFGAGMGLFLPGLNAQIEPKLGKLVKKTFLLFLAHPGLSLLMIFVLVISVALSIVTLGFFPGVMGIAIWFQVCFKFVLNKYEWLEAHPDADPKNPPWDEILAEDMEKIGPRSLKGMFFPWKN